jgi:myo-inositol catabolism protein IolC
MGEIAPVVGLQAQYQVSRLLKLKEFRADIRQQMLKDLRDRTLAKATIYTHPDQLQTLEQQVEAALDEQIAAAMQEAETEASIAKNRSSRSLFAQRLCRHLEARRNSP